MASNNDAFIAFTSHFQDLLICSVCLDIPTSSPIYQCENGHLLCKSCKPQLRNCPVCRKPLPITRNLLAEQSLEKLLIPCQNEGCKEKVLLSGGQLKHEKNCFFSAIKCPIPECLKITCLAKLVEHFQNDHQVRRVSNDTFSGILKSVPPSFPGESDVPPVLIIHNGRHFFVQLSFDSHFCYLWVNFMGNEEEASKYACDIEVKINSRSYQIFSTKSPCVSIEIPMQAAQKNEFGLILNKRLFRRSAGELDKSFEKIRMRVFVKIGSVPSTLTCINCSDSDSDVPILEIDDDEIFIDYDFE